MKKRHLLLSKKNKYINFFCLLIKLFIVFIFFFTNYSIVNSQWEECNNCSECVSRKINGDAVWCFITDGNNTYTGISGGVFMTTNYGDNWIPKNRGLKCNNDTNIISLVINGNNIFAGSLSDGIFLSKDKGENWVRKSNGLPCLADGDTIFLTKIYDIIIIGNNIFAGTSNSVYKSIDFGDNWILKNNGLPQDTFHRDIFSVAVKGNNIFAGTEFGVFISTDNGENWMQKNKGMGNLGVSSLIIKGDSIYAGTMGSLFISTNNGDSWKKIKDSIVVDGITIMGNNIIVGGYGIDISTDNGMSWSAKNSGLTGLAVTPLIINGDYIFAGVDNYGIYRAKLSDLGITDVKETKQTNEIKIIPNPASDEFRLKFQALFETTVQLSVFDLLGNCVFCQTLQSTEGTNEKIINCEKLPSGYYYVKINANENVQSIPLMIIK